jgi:hypothetical protein
VIAGTVALLACGTGEGVPGGAEPPGLIGFVGGVGPGIGFIGGKGPHDAGPYPQDGEGPDAGGSAGHDAGLDAATAPDGASASEDGGRGEDGGSTVGVMLNLPPGFFVFLDWTITGPGGTYSGSTQFGAAQSIEFVVGGILAGSGYTITLTGTDPSGDPCTGTSAPFAVAPGGTAVAGVTIECLDGDGGARPANVTTGNVAVEAGVLSP